MQKSFSFNPVNVFFVGGNTQFLFYSSIKILLQTCFKDVSDMM